MFPWHLLRHITLEHTYIKNNTKLLVYLKFKFSGTSIFDLDFKLHPRNMFKERHEALLQIL